jgi:hypothetical protein
VDVFDLDAWAARFGLLPEAPELDDLVRFGDQEVSVAIARRADLYVVEGTDRGGPRRVQGSFTGYDDARRYLVATLGIGWRVGTSLPPFPPRSVAPGAALEEGPTAYHLSWPGGSAEFPRGLAGLNAAQDFSWVIGASLAEIAHSLLDLEARPLADRAAQA